MGPHRASGAEAGRSAPPSVAIVAAGTGGHIYPALAVAEALRRLEPEVAVWFLTTRRGLGPEILARHGQRFTVVVGEPAPRRLAAGGAFTFAAAMARAPGRPGRRCAGTAPGRFWPRAGTGRCPPWPRPAAWGSHRLAGTERPAGRATACWPGGPGWWRWASRRRPGSCPRRCAAGCR
ncbi:glycosyltransferase [Geochorda subterranea]|uniref:Glycosyltransferase n=1 Tax=Geochorda subterranea TaxID=3109564 RepID=A0ABZ1BSQ9_9FIRM|nr:glycosyltransferase [Limnochorda sp. LNt]WRP15836.1 glycosyltransferase [Limnochorda sp. LNt]